MIVRRVQLPGHVQVIAPAGSEMVVTVAGEGTYSIKVGADTVTVAHAAELVFPTTKLDGILWNGPTKTRTEIDAILSESTRNIVPPATCGGHETVIYPDYADERKGHVLCPECAHWYPGSTTQDDTEGDSCPECGLAVWHSPKCTQQETQGEKK